MEVFSHIFLFRKQSTVTQKTCYSKKKHLVAPTTQSNQKKTAYCAKKKRSRGVDISKRSNTDDSDEDYDPEDDNTEEEKKAKQNNRDLPHRRAKNKQHKEHISADVGSPHEDSPDDVEQAPAGFGWKGNFYFLMYI